VKRAPAVILPAIAVERASARPLHRQIYEGYRDAIVARQLRAGQRLPSTRHLAAELRISRIPVLNAFEQLLAEGYFESRAGSGTFVARAVPDELAVPRSGGRPRQPPSRSAPRLVARYAASLRTDTGPWFQGQAAFGVGQPPIDAFPLEIWSRLVARIARLGDRSLLRYGKAMGYEPLREQVAEYLRTARGVRCEASQIMIVGGSQAGIELAARVLVDDGSSVWLEEPGYFGIQNALRLVGARMIPVPVDEEGLAVSAGIERAPRARAAFVTPSHQFPMGVTMSASRRLRLLDWAQSTGAWIVEDDYDSEYRFGSSPITSLQGLDRDSRVIYIGTFTKILFPAMRIAYVVIPPDLVPAFMAVRRVTDMFSPPFVQAVLTDFIREGHFARHVRRMRLLCAERRETLVAALARERSLRLGVLGDAAGMFLTASLPPGTPDREIGLTAAREGLKVLPLSSCALETPAKRGVVLGYGGSTNAEIVDGAARLGAILRRMVPRTRSRSR